MLPHIPATRAMFAYPSESASSTVCGGGKTTPWPSCRLHVKSPTLTGVGDGIRCGRISAFHLSCSLVDFCGVRMLFLPYLLGKVLHDARFDHCVKGDVSVPVVVYVLARVGVSVDGG